MTKGYVAEHFRGAKRDYVPCALRALCLRTPEKTMTREVTFFRGRDESAPETHTARMNAGSTCRRGGRYAQRFAAVRASIVLSPAACSGDMYRGVPSAMPVCVTRAASSAPQM